MVSQCGHPLAVALTGETAPGSGGGVYASFGVPSIADNGQVACYATISGGTPGAGIFLATPVPNPVPAVSGWGQFTLGMLLLAIGARVVLRQRSAAPRVLHWS